MNLEQARKHYEKLRDQGARYPALWRLYSEILDCLRYSSTEHEAQGKLRKKAREEGNAGAKVSFRVAVSVLNQEES